MTFTANNKVQEIVTSGPMALGTYEAIADILVRYSVASFTSEARMSDLLNSGWNRTVRSTVSRIFTCMKLCL